MKILYTVRRAVLALIILIPLAAFAPEKKLRWMAIGDSITYHNSHIGDTKGRIKHGYMDYLVEQLPNISFAEHGRPGWTVKGIAENIGQFGLEKANVYSIFLGTNDWWVDLPIGTLADYQNNTGTTTAYGAYRVLIDYIRKLNADAHIILITPMQRTDFVDLNNQNSIIYGSYKPNRSGHYLLEYADAIKTIAKEEKLDLADLYYKSGVTPKTAVAYKRLKDPKTGEYRNYKYPDYLDVPFDPKTDEYPYPVDAMTMTYDGLHPSDKGHQLIAKMLAKIMKKY
ncbi:SGNH/GDSL hydrolase family protein [Mucilaginibacter myungsuensis]|uniref:SGNH/GDSL hydrolase family protein n=1 Tax=Mucilaginibacter myungsuensis TaxID=649104 RepID=A0A929KZ08_9SPHI|nr:SGNH/GDSL hydrolase family protein [Mucilaginibacter myungsuensis]MBE9664301.1 SGNH/GDSL hydrolase family protein [Mucilaginibacter myungsuensis]MDN3597010.1 SGNH/GDSL hydrolase family protein [Mucilaginibacter myungsuensis]